MIRDLLRYIDDELQAAEARFVLSALLEVSK
jgi:hypothetical protein